MDINIELINPHFLKKASFQQKLSNNISQCLTCERKCRIPRSNFCFLWWIKSNRVLSDRKDCRYPINCFNQEAGGL